MSARILVVEDDKLQKDVLTSVLRTRAYDVETASDGLGAVWKILCGSFDLVLIDYLLPEIDGLATARLIHDIMGCAARPRMVALTAKPDSLTEREMGPGEAFDEVVAKTAGMSCLLASVGRQLQTAPSRKARRAAEVELLLKDWSDYEDAPLPAAVSVGRQGACRILVVEDDPLQQAVLKAALERCGYDVQTALDGLDAVRKMRCGAFDLALVDYQTPEIDGLATARLIGALLSEATRPRLIALTATPDRLSAWEATSGKVFDQIVAKSASLPTLLATIRCSLRPPAAATPRFQGG
jgi:two-component system sensor histidine kinase/response regulator